MNEMQTMIELSDEVLEDMVAISEGLSAIRARKLEVERSFPAIPEDIDLLELMSAPSTPLEARYEALCVAEAHAVEQARKDEVAMRLRCLCGRCGGHGRIDAYHWNKGGICFACDGLGYIRA